LRYEPVVELGSLEVVGFAAEPEWVRDDGHRTAGADLSRAAERAGLATRLDLFVIEEAGRQLARWNDLHLDQRPLSMSVHVADRFVLAPGFSASAREAIGRAGVDPSHIVVALDGAPFTRPAPTLVAQLDALRRFGVRTTLTRFGARSAPLRLLESLPLDAVEIEPALLASLGMIRRDATIVGGIVALAHALELGVTASGVDTDSRLSTLQTLGCDTARGPYVAGPLTPSDAAAVARHRSLHMLLL
jgi:EAL domain-containing protein (putative c-di-GMP-specific phosphodiesterase class I)